MSMDHFFDSRINMPVEMKKAFEEQQETIKSLIETTKRQETVVKDLLNEIEKQGKRSSIQGVLSLIYSIVAVLIAGLAVWFSLQDFRSDEVWQQKQIRLLKEIRQSIRP